MFEISARYASVYLCSENCILAKLAFILFIPIAVAALALVQGLNGSVLLAGRDSQRTFVTVQNGWLQVDG